MRWSTTETEIDEQTGYTDENGISWAPTKFALVGSGVIWWNVAVTYWVISLIRARTLGPRTGNRSFHAMQRTEHWKVKGTRT